MVIQHASNADLDNTLGGSCNCKLIGCIHVDHVS